MWLPVRWTWRSPRRFRGESGSEREGRGGKWVEMYADCVSPQTWGTTAHTSLSLGKPSPGQYLREHIEWHYVIISNKKMSKMSGVRHSSIHISCLLPSLIWHGYYWDLGISDKADVIKLVLNSICLFRIFEALEVEEFEKITLISSCSFSANLMVKSIWKDKFFVMPFIVCMLSRSHKRR